MDEAIRVLYVGPSDDEQARLFETQHAALKVQMATDLGEAMDCLEEESLDCVVTRQKLPAETGTGLLEAVRVEFPELPFVFFLEECSDELVQEVLAANATAILPQVEDEAAAVSLLADQVVTMVQNQRTAQRKGELERITDMIRTLNRALVHALTQEEIDQRACEIISDAEPYRFVWVGEHDSDEQVVTPRASAGVDADYLETITVTTDDAPTAQGPTGRAIQTQEIQVMQNIPGDPTYKPWREQAIERGYKSSAAVPLIYDETLYGVLNVYADRVNAFDEAEVDLLREAGDDMAYALNEAQMREELRQFERAVEQAADAIFVTDIRGTIEYVNPAFEALTGYSREEAIDRTPRILKSGEQDEAYYEQLWNTILDGEIWEEDIVNKRKSGKDYYAEQTIAPLSDETGAIKGFVAIQRDVTDRKDRERELKESRETYRTLYESIHDMVFVHDHGGTILSVNRAAAETLGYDRDELESMHMNDIHPEDAPVPKGAYADNKQAVIESELVTSDGRTLTVSVSRTPVMFFGEDAILGVARDVTERKAREEELQARKELYEAVVKNVHDGLVIVQNDMIEYVNPRVTEVTGYPANTLTGESPAMLAVEDDRERVMELCRAHSREDASSGPHEITVLTRTDEQIPVEINIGTLEYNGAPATIAAIRDITERVDRTRQLRVLDRVLRHNLNNDMTIIQGYAETIRAEASEEIAPYAETILSQSADLLEMVQKERAIVEEISEPPEHIEFDLVRSIDNVVSALRDQYPDAEINCDLPDHAIVTATESIEQALRELVENAIQHADQPSPTVSISVRAHETEVQVEITDDGPGIPSEEIKVLTREREVEPLYHGSGLGLWLVNWIVRRSNGAIQFEENDPRGSVVTIDLPGV